MSASVELPSTCLTSELLVIVAASVERSPGRELIVPAAESGVPDAERTTGGGGAKGLVPIGTDPISCLVERGDMVARNAPSALEIEPRGPEALASTCSG